MSDADTSWPEAEDDREHLAAADPLSLDAREAWSRLYDHARGVAQRELGPRVDPDEVAHMVFERLFETRKRFDPSADEPIQNARAYVTGAVKNTFFRLFRQGKSELLTYDESPVEAAASDIADPVAARMDLVQTLQTWMDSEPLHARLLAAIRHRETPSLLSLATELDAARGTVRRALNGLLERLDHLWSGALDKRRWRARDDAVRMRILLSVFSGLTERDWEDLLGKDSAPPQAG